MKLMIDSLRRHYPDQVDESVLKSFNTLSEGVISAGTSSSRHPCRRPGRRSRPGDVRRKENGNGGMGSRVEETMDQELEREERAEEDVSPASPFRVRHLDHTADVGIEIRAPDLAGLPTGAVDGMMGLILGDDRPDEEERRTVRVQGGDPALLLRNLLREVLYLHEAEGFAVARTTVAVDEQGEGAAAPGPGGDGEGDRAARADLLGGPDPGPPIRELKGVTLHGLEAREAGDGEWFARVIFDV
jgi:SHS2 domain-containing protein